MSGVSGVSGGVARSPWPLIGLLYGCGLLAAAQLGKMSALAPVLGPALGLSLTTTAWAVSLLEIGGALLGALGGWAAARLGLVATLRGGLLALALASGLQALAQGGISLLAGRLLEALGYLGVIVTAPVLIARHAARHDAQGRPHTTGMAMSLWSSFVPVGLALGASGAAVLAEALGWRGALASGAGVALLLALGVWRTRGLDDPALAGGAAVPSPAGSDDVSAPRAGQEALAADAAPAAAAAALAPAPSGAAARSLGAAAWCLALAFGVFAVLQVGMLALLPTLLVRETGLSAAAAGQWTALTAFAAVLGSAVAALLLRQGIAPRWPMLLSQALPALLLFGIFRPAPSVAAVVGLAVAINALGGIYASLSFALLPQAAGGPAQMVRANGLLAQCGASGSLLGPPSFAAAAQWMGGLAAAGASAAGAAAGASAQASASASGAITAALPPAWLGWPMAAAVGCGLGLLSLPLVWRATRAR